MNANEIAQHLIVCGLRPQSRDRYRVGCIVLRVTDERRTGPPNTVVTVSFYDDIADTDLVFVVDMAASHFIENALAESPQCRQCGLHAVRSTALRNVFAGSSEWNDGSMEGATLTMSETVQNIECWKCPECGHSWT